MRLRRRRRRRQQQQQQEKQKKEEAQKEWTQQDLQELCGALVTREKRLVSPKIFVEQPRPQQPAPTPIPMPLSAPPCRIMIVTALSARLSRAGKLAQPSMIAKIRAKASCWRKRGLCRRCGSLQACCLGQVWEHRD